MSEKKRVVLVGHCGADTSLLSWMVHETLGEVPIVSAHDDQSLEAYLKADSILLINRVLDGSFRAGGGIDLIRSLAEREDARRPMMLLISDYPQAQRDAEAAGAAPGFGKSEVGQPHAAERLQQALGE